MRSITLNESWLILCWRSLDSDIVKNVSICTCRFHFISTEELLAILGGGNPICIQEHMIKVGAFSMVCCFNRPQTYFSREVIRVNMWDRFYSRNHFFFFARREKMFDNVDRFSLEQKQNAWMTIIVLNGLLSSEGENLHFKNKGIYYPDLLPIYSFLAWLCTSPHWVSDIGPNPFVQILFVHDFFHGNNGLLEVEKWTNGLMENRLRKGNETSYDLITLHTLTTYEQKILFTFDLQQLFRFILYCEWFSCAN